MQYKTKHPREFPLLMKLVLIGLIFVMFTAGPIRVMDYLITTQELAKISRLNSWN